MLHVGLLSGVIFSDPVFPPTMRCNQYSTDLLEVENEIESGNLHLTEVTQ
jgi:hypothetical protein